MNNAGKDTSRESNPKPPAAEVMQAFDALPGVLRARVAYASTDIDPRGLADAIAAGVSAERLADALAARERTRTI